MQDTKRKKPFLIGVAGGISSGKSTVCKRIMEQLNTDQKQQIFVISFDSFYKKLTPEEQLKAQRGEHNFDHPTAFDEELGYQTIVDLINGKEVGIPLYDNKTYSLKNEKIVIKPESVPDVLIVEGILVFYFPKIRDLFQIKLFVDCDADTRLARRVVRDLNEYNRDLEAILTYYAKYVKPAFEEFCLPTKKYADVVIPRGAENNVAINLIVQHIDDLLKPLSHNNHNSNNSTINNTHNPEVNHVIIINSNNNNRSPSSNKSTGSNAVEIRRSYSNSNHNSPNSGSNHSFTNYSADQSPIKRNEASQRPH